MKAGNYGHAAILRRAAFLTSVSGELVKGGLPLSERAARVLHEAVTTRNAQPRRPQLRLIQGGAA
jgi:hypothetical protein